MVVRNPSWEPAHRFFSDSVPETRIYWGLTSPRAFAAAYSVAADGQTPLPFAVVQQEGQASSYSGE